MGVLKNEQGKYHQRLSVLLIEKGVTPTPIHKEMYKTPLTLQKNKQEGNKRKETTLKNTTLKNALIDNHYTIIDHTIIDHAMQEKSDIHAQKNYLRLSEVCIQYHPDLMIIKTDAPSSDTLKELTIIDQLTPLPVLIFAKRDTQSLIKSSIKAGVSAYIVNEVQPHRLNSLIIVAVERFKERQLLRAELEETKTQLAGRKIIERAKGYIMQQKNITEQAAFTLLREMAMNNGKSLATVAKNITDVDDLMNR